MILHNKLDRTSLLHRLHKESFRRITLSFYRYVIIEDVTSFRNHLYQELDKLNVLGRIYVANEGINAQLSVPEYHFEQLRKLADEAPYLQDVPFKIAIEDDGKSFIKLIVRIRKQIVADGLEDGSFDVTNTGTHLDAEAFNRAMEDPDTITVDMRNRYESEIGHFENAVCPPAESFREALPMALDMLKGKEDNRILLYCTGGIRCEKASAWFRHHGFNDVNQLCGGIIRYAREVNDKGLDMKFRGSNFVFDERLGERISGDVISRCHQCGQPCDHHVNCSNDLCHRLFIQCEACRTGYQGACSDDCVAAVSA